MRRGGWPGLRELPGVKLAGAKGTALTPPQTFPARPGAQGEGRYPGVGRRNSGSRASAPRREVCAPVIWRRKSGFSTGRGPLSASRQIAGDPLSPVRTGPVPPLPRRTLPGAPPTCARGSGARSPLTGRWRLDRPMGWGARRGRRAVWKLWAGTARPPSSLSVVQSLLPTLPSFPRSRLPGRDVRSQESEWEGPQAAGGVRRRERPEPGKRPQPLPAPLRRAAKFGAESVAQLGGESGRNGKETARS